MKFHPLADVFPLIEGAEFDDLVADIKAYGLIEPIIVFEDMILDGRNRYRACEAAGVEPTFTPYRGDDPVAFVVSLNLKRRHLNESQRAMVGAKLATLRDGQRADLVEGLPIGRASELLNVSERSIARAREVRDRGALELVSAVERGEVSVSVAADIATQPVDEQREIVARGEKDILQAAKDIRAKRAAVRRAEWTARTVELSKVNAPLPSERRYPIIYADPPWKFDVYDGGSGLDRAAAAHYPTMDIEEIYKLPVAALATPDAVLFLWSTAPHLQKAFGALAAWGFEYKTHLVWVKPSPGLGYWVRNQHELLLIGTRGHMRSPAEGARPPSVITAQRREHSRKPDEAYELIEAIYPELPKIELFARSAREGWTVWGNQAPSTDDGLDIPEFLRRDLPPKGVAA
jgi:N6-adenosine-specific RNA methylase IME4/ParB-like chromosome segregation protein Spo0J